MTLKIERLAKTDQLLLQAAFCSADRTQKAWNTWQKGVDFDDFRSDRLYLVPQLYHNLSQSGIKTPVIQKLKGIYHYTWLKNQDNWQLFKNTLLAFSSVDIIPLFLQETALVLEDDRVNAAFPFNQMNLYVRSNEAEKTFTVLRNTGWIPYPTVPQHHTRSFIEAATEQAFFSSSQLTLNLNWILMRTGSFDEDIWTKAVQVGKWGYKPNLEHQIIYACLPHRRSKFIYDLDLLMFMLRHNPLIQWNYLIAEAQKHRVMFFLKNALFAISELCDVLVPHEVISQLIELEPERTKLTEYMLVRWDHGYIKRMKSLWLDYTFIQGHELSRELIVGFPRFLQKRWCLDRMGDIPVFAIRKVYRDLFGRFNLQG